MERGQKLGEQGLTHSLKKAPGSKKRKKHANGESSAATETEPATSSSSNRTNTPTNGSTGIKNAATAMLTAKVLEEQNEKKKRRRMNENLESLFTKSSDKEKRKDGDFMTRGFSIPAGARRI